MTLFDDNHVVLNEDGSIYVEEWTKRNFTPIANPYDTSFNVNYINNNTKVNSIQVFNNTNLSGKQGPYSLTIEKDLSSGQYVLYIHYFGYFKNTPKVYLDMTNFLDTIDGFNT